MSPSAATTSSITIEGFLADAHGAKYRDVVRTHPEAFARLMDVLNHPDQQAELLTAEQYGHPALSGIVQTIESEEVLAGPVANVRFRQAVGVAVRLVMESMGWSTTGRKGPVRGATQFKRAERYGPPLQSIAVSPGDRARAAFQAVERIGDEEERAQTASDLLLALAQTRRAEHRSF